MSESKIGEDFIAFNEFGEVNSSAQLVEFTGETASAFDEWIVRFYDYIDVFGTNWTELEKINRLKLYLGVKVRSIFECLPLSEKTTLANALKNIRNKLDSPHFKELAYKRLAACYQKEGEFVSDFIKRLIPLVNTTSSLIPPEAKEEMLCRALIEKVRPEFRRSLHLVGPLIGRKDFKKLVAYLQELELGVIGGGTSSYNSSNIQSINANRISPNPNELIQSTSNASAITTNGYNQNRVIHEQNEQLSNICFICKYCNKPNFEQVENQNYDNWVDDKQELRDMVNELAIQVHEMKMRMDY